MKIVIPVNKKDRYLSVISSIEENTAWAMICLEGSKISNVEFLIDMKKSIVLSIR